MSMTTEQKKIYNDEYRLRPGIALRLKEYGRNKYLANKQEILAKNKDWSAKHRDKNYFKAYHEKNKGRWPAKPLTPEQKERQRVYRQNHKVKLCAYWKQYRKDHPDKTRAHNKANWHKRRALLKNAQINVSGIKEFIYSIRTKSRSTCYYCQKSTPIKHIHFDHIIPLAKGGMHSVENLCVSCDKCNQSKHDKLIADWMTLGQQLLTL